MSELILIRHGQASLFADDYDQLSEHGERQATKLGSFWLQEGFRCDRCFVGPRTRHIESANRVRQVFSQAGKPWPSPRTLADLDEHQVDQLVMQQGKRLASRRPPLDQLVQSLEAASEPKQKQRSFQRLFEATATRWVAGDDDLGVESWIEFRARIRRAIDHIMELTGRGKTVVVFTSAGPITVALQRALACPDDVALATGWRLWNCSSTGFVYSGQRFTLDHFNHVPHLSRVEWTYR